MARIGVFSDTHGSIENLRFFTPRLGQLDSVFHLGDCVEDAPLLAARLNTGFVSVRGNCDPWADAPREQIVPWHGHRILLLHGHTHMGQLALYCKAKSESCSVVCSGHTHVPSIEEYDGVCLLATNLIGNIDEAFMRRMTYVVRFPFPDPPTREEIYRRMVPASAPVEDDIDWAFLAKAFELSGGYIKNIALSAAFLAAGQGVPISMRHMLRAAVNELKKNEIVVVREQLREYADLLDD